MDLFRKATTFTDLYSHLSYRYLTFASNFKPPSQCSQASPAKKFKDLTKVDASKSSPAAGTVLSRPLSTHHSLLHWAFLSSMEVSWRTIPRDK